MRILFDQGTPVPLRDHLTGHTVQTAFELGWSNLENGELLAASEDSFDLLITTDQQLKYQQNLAGRKLSVIVLTTTSWPRIKEHVSLITDAIAPMSTGEYREVDFK
jgi:predicted nuclease of predicted toxin-antitoxin system